MPSESFDAKDLFLNKGGEHYLFKNDWQREEKTGIMVYKNK